MKFISISRNFWDKKCREFAVCLWIHLLSQSGRAGVLLMEINCRVSVGLIKKNETGEEMN